MREIIPKLWRKSTLFRGFVHPLAENSHTMSHVKFYVERLRGRLYKTLPFDVCFLVFLA